MAYPLLLRLLSTWLSSPELQLPVVASYSIEQKTIRGLPMNLYLCGNSDKQTSRLCFLAKSGSKSNEGKDGS